MGFGRFSFVALLSLALNAVITTADNSTVTYDWRVTYVSTACDGVSLTEYGINDDVSTRALIELELGQTVQLSVTNELDEMTCLHWHGLQQLGTQEMDGTSDITQCGIAPGGSAVYTFTPEQAGTYWWHSHHSTQYAYGLRGPLIVHAPTDDKQSWETEIAAEYTLQLADLYHALPGIVPMWDSVIINSLGRYNCTAAASTATRSAIRTSRSLDSSSKQAANIVCVLSTWARWHRLSLVSTDTSSPWWRPMGNTCNRPRRSRLCVLMLVNATT